MRISIVSVFSIFQSLTVRLGAAQLVCWGVGYYLIGVFGEAVVADVGWSRSEVYGGFSIALLAMAATSGAVGRAIDRRGGGGVMALGAALLALGCVAFAMARTLPFYYAAWALLGLALRMTLYDAAFAALARIAGRDAKGPIARITLLGGLAATTFWPIGHFLIEWLGWRNAAFCYAGFALLTAPIYLSLPPPLDKKDNNDTETNMSPSSPDAWAATLYALIAMLTNFLNAGLSAHMIAMLAGLGMGTAAAVNAAALRGVGQSAARGCEVLFGGGLHPLNLNLLAAALVPPAFVIAFWSGESTAAALLFCFFYGAGNGLFTIARGSLPLVLFNFRSYGTVTGRLLAPGFALAAAAPLIYALIIDRFGAAAGLWLSVAAGAALLAASVELRRCYLRSQNE